MIYLLLCVLVILISTLYFSYRDERLCLDITKLLQDVKKGKLRLGDFIVIKTVQKNILSVSCYVNNITTSENLVSSWEIKNNSLCNLKIYDASSFKFLRKAYISWCHKYYTN